MCLELILKISIKGDRHFKKVEVLTLRPGTIFYRCRRHHRLALRSLRNIRGLEMEDGESEAACASRGSHVSIQSCRSPRKTPGGKITT